MGPRDDRDPHTGSLTEHLTECLEVEVWRPTLRLTYFKEQGELHTGPCYLLPLTDTPPPRGSQVLTSPEVWRRPSITSI